MFWKGAPFSFWTGWLDGFGVRAGAGARGARRCSDTSGPRPRPDSKTARSTGTGTLILRAGRLHRPAAQRFVAPLCIPLVHPRLVLPQTGPFPGHRFPRGAALRQFTLQFLQPPDHLHRRFVLHRPLQRFPPRRQRCAVLPKTRPGHRCQFLHRGRRPVLSPSPSAAVGQTTPLSAAATPAAGAPPGGPTQSGCEQCARGRGSGGSAADGRPGRRAGGVGLGLGGGLAGPARQFSGWAPHLGLQRTEVWIAGGHELLGSRFQVHGPMRRHHRQQSRTLWPTPRTDGSKQASCIRAVVLPATPRLRPLKN